MSDITTRDQALKALHDLKTEQKRLADRGDAMEQQLAQKTADLKEIQKVLAESQAPKVETVSDKEATLRRYVRADGTLDATELVSDPVDRGAWHSELKRMVDDRNLARLMTKSGKGCAVLDQRLEKHIASAPSVITRAFSDASGVGAEWIPDLLLPELFSKLYQAGNVEALFPTLTMPGKEVRLPFLTLQVKPYLKSGATWGTITAEDDTTAQTALTAQSLAARITVDEDASADSIVMGWTTRAVRSQAPSRMPSRMPSSMAIPTPPTRTSSQAGTRSAGGTVLVSVARTITAWGSWGSVHIVLTTDQPAQADRTATTTMGSWRPAPRLTAPMVHLVISR